MSPLSTVLSALVLCTAVSVGFGATLEEVSCKTDELGVRANMIISMLQNLTDDMDDGPEDAFPSLTTGSRIVGDNPCAGKKASTQPTFNNLACRADATVVVMEQAGANVTRGYVGGLNTTFEPQTNAYWKTGNMCPVNVHWHLGAEHLSVGEYDEDGNGPSTDARERNLAGYGETREGFLCHHYDDTDPKFTTEYDWKHCVGMHVGNTYEVHWPHSAAGDCGTPHQFQSPFYDGVFCNFPFDNATQAGAILAALPSLVGVQAQVFTIVNDDSYYYPDLMRGALRSGDFWADVAIYTGSTTGTSRDNEICSAYSPITWQVDRKCHMISASSFDKMCFDMKSQNDDMSSDLYAHGARELVADDLAANNMYDASGTHVGGGARD